MSKPFVLFIRGIPGAGKTTAAKKLGLPIVEADDFFVDDQAVYQYDPSLISDAHNWARGQMAYLLRKGADCCVVNTFSRKWELDSYMEVAHRLGANTAVFRCLGRFQNQHGVPPEKVQKIAERFEAWPGEFIESEHADVGSIRRALLVDR